MSEQRTYMVLSGYDGRVIAQGLSQTQRDALLDKFIGANCPPPRWKAESK